MKAARRNTLQKMAALFCVLSLACSMAAISVCADAPADTATLARTLALTFANADNGSEAWTVHEQTTLYDFYGNVSGYVFDLETPSAAGYIVVGDNDGRDPVIEFSFEHGSFIQTAKEELHIQNPKVFFVGNLNYYIGRADGSDLHYYGAGGLETVEEGLESLQSGTPEMDIDSLVNYLQDLRGGGSSPPQSGLITIDPSFYESGYVRSIVGQVVRYPAGGRYVDMGDFQGYDHHCGAVCATNLMIYWNNRDDCKYKDLMYGSANDVFKGFYDKMGSNVWLPTFDSVVKSHFATYANGCSTNYTWFGATWNEIETGLSENKPVVLLLQKHKEYTNHYVLGVGYAVYRYSDESESQYIRIIDGWTSNSSRYVHYSAGYQNGGKIHLMRVYPK